MGREGLGSLLLLFLLTGEAHLTTQQLPLPSPLEYMGLKKAIIQRVHAAASLGGTSVTINLVVMEQFIARLPKKLLLGYSATTLSP